MGRILSLRRRRGAIPEFEASLARLSEELVLTESFTELMLRDGNLEAAAAAVDEQRDRLRKAEAQMLASLRPHGRRTQVVAAAVAALMMLGSGALVALRALSPNTQTAKVAIQRIEQRLDQVAEAPTAIQANRIAGDLPEFGTIDENDLRDPEIADALLALLDEKIATLENGPLTLKGITDRLRRERRRVLQATQPQPAPLPSSTRSTRTQSPEPPPSAPETPNPVAS